VTTPEDDARAGFDALANKIPLTMEASIVALHQFVEVSSAMKRAGFSRDPVEENAMAFQNLFETVSAWMRVTLDCIITLDNRIERLEGRPGLPDGAITRIMSEFSD
jgi:hypothetical protein